MLSLFSLSSDKPVADKNTFKVIPENSVSLLSKIWFSWMDNLILLGYKRNLNCEDMWAMENSECSKQITKRLELDWAKSVGEYNRKKNENYRKLTKKSQQNYGSIQEIGKNEDKGKNNLHRTRQIKRPSLTWTLIKVNDY